MDPARIQRISAFGWCLVVDVSVPGKHTTTVAFWGGVSPMGSRLWGQNCGATSFVHRVAGSRLSPRWIGISGSRLDYFSMAHHCASPMVCFIGRWPMRRLRRLELCHRDLVLRWRPNGTPPALLHHLQTLGQSTDSIVGPFWFLTQIYACTRLPYRYVTRQSYPRVTKMPAAAQSRLLTCSGPTPCQALYHG